MGYFWVNQAQEYLQSLGFKPGGALQPILARPYDLRINQYGVDNSYMTDTGDYIRLGKGGVDDAEDAEVIMHEYGHAIHADQVPGFYGTAASTRARSASPSATTSPSRPASRPRSSTAGRSTPSRPARWTGTPPPTPTRRTASVASTST